VHQTTADVGKMLAQVHDGMTAGLDHQVGQYGVQKVVYTAVFDRQAAGHVALARTERRIQDESPDRSLVT
jgi:hypothetical protein